MKRCTKCGARNLDEEKACTLCGTVFPRALPPSEAFEPRRTTKTVERTLSKPDGTTPVPPPSGPPREDLRAERHYLVITFGEPVKLDPKVASIMIGRDLDAQVKVPSLKASRRHAELRWKDGQALLRDLGSRNGTFVDGSRVKKEQVLEDGQDVRIGDSVLQYRFLVPGEDLARQQGPADTILDEPAIAPVASSPLPPRGLEGELVFLPFGELLKRLISLRASGAVELRTAGSEGKVLVQNGVATQTSYAGLEGAVALQALASLTRGTFRFLPDQSWRPPATAQHQAPPLGPS